MSEARAWLTASLEPRTSSRVQSRARTTFTAAPSQSPSVRSRHASRSPQRTSSTVARSPARQAERAQATRGTSAPTSAMAGVDVRSTVGAGVVLRLGIRLSNALPGVVENDSQMTYNEQYPAAGMPSMAFGAFRSGLAGTASRDRRGGRHGRPSPWQRRRRDVTSRAPRTAVADPPQIASIDATAGPGTGPDERRRRTAAGHRGSSARRCRAPGYTVLAGVG